MGLIRKTVSVATLGVVPFRSKKEKLRRAESARRKAETDLERERTARAEADHRVQEAKRRVRAAELESLHEAKRAAKARGRRGRRRAKEARTVLERLGEMVDSAQPVVEERARVAAEKAGKVSRRAAARAQKEATRAADRARKEAKEGRKRAAAARKDARVKLRELEHEMAPKVEAAVERGKELRDEAIIKGRVLGHEAAEQLRERAGSRS